MKYLCLLAVLLSGFSPVLPAQESPAAVAQRNEAEERHRWVSAKIEDLEATIQSYQKRFTALAEEIRGIREELAKMRDTANRDSGLTEILKQHAKAIEEVDRKRQADNEKVLASLSRLKEQLSRPPPGPPPTPPPSTPSVPSGEAIEWTVRPKDTLSGIVSALSKRGVKVTMKEVQEANPNVNWNSLKVGQKILIPAAMPK